VRRTGGLSGQAIAIDGLAGSAADVLVRVERIDGSSQVARPLPGRPWFTIEEAASPLEVAKTYTLLGIEHILVGFDHLLFVLALLFLVRGPRRILLTITAFTVAHSFTLAAATLDVVSLPGPPVEATIALSIVFLAREMATSLGGRPGLTERYPWIVAFVFGLLHGLGFAGVLAEIGLPQHAIPTALLCFNIGVEIGQLLFVGVALALFALLTRVLSRWLRTLRWIPSYAIGTVASFWLVERVASF
jgi:hydrogenase/urease accessory protein HupE